jgi:hypothetical protein
MIVWLLEGQRSEDIQRSWAEHFPAEDFHKTLDAAWDHFERIAAAAPDVLRGWCLEAYRELHRRMVDVGDYTGALRAIKELMSYACSARPD